MSPWASAAGAAPPPLLSPRERQSAVRKEVSFALSASQRCHKLPLKHSCAVESGHKIDHEPKKLICGALGFTQISAATRATASVIFLQGLFLSAA